MGYLRHIQRCNQHNPKNYIPFIVDDQFVGRFRHAFAAKLMALTDVFSVNEDFVSLQEKYKGYEQRSLILGEVLQKLVSNNEHPYLLGEMYPVSAGKRENALFEIDRSAAALFGLRTFALHVNGFVRKSDGIHMWVGKRAADRGTFPGMLDQLVAGGLPVGETLESNLCKECHEEANIDFELAKSATPVGAVSYNIDTAKGYKYDTLYCYDLELPEEFTPRCNDGEVDSFELLPMADVMQRVLKTDDFKPNCNLIIIDFLLRHGFIPPEHQEYLDLITGLHSAMSVPDQVAKLGIQYPSDVYLC